MSLNLNFLPTEITIGGLLSSDASLQRQVDAGAVVVDSSRRRPYYFDGRLLTAADLTADQDYHRARQADLARAIGGGIVRGLTVRLGREAGSNAPTLVIDAGLGLTPGGDIVQVPGTLELPVSRLNQTTELDLQMGIQRVQGAGRLTGLYVLALRPIAFHANPVASYPTTLDGARSVRAGDLIEGTVVTLVPVPDRSGSENADAKRARVAREVFVDRQRPGVPEDALPLAMLALDGGALKWLDMHMVRREVGAESTLAAGLAPRPRALLEAWFEQHLDAVDDIDDDTQRAGFTAASRFEALPPVGPLPASTVRFGDVLGTAAFLQSYFPPQVDCEFAFIPSDELAALVQESLALPPIDLRAGDDALDRLSVLILAPVTRQQLEAFKRELGSVSRPLLAAAGGLVAKRSPLEAMLRLSQPGLQILPRPVPETDRAIAAWQRAIEQTRQQAALASGNRPMFWYLRRRQLPYTSEISGVTLRLAGAARELDAEVDRRLVADAAAARFARIGAALPTLGLAEAKNLIGAPRLAVSAAFNGTRFATSDLLRLSALRTLEVQQASADVPFDHASVLEVARSFGDPRLGEGIDAMADAADDATRAVLRGDTVSKAIAEAAVAPQLDRAARALGSAKLAEFARSVVSAASSGDPHTALKTLVGDGALP